MGSSGVIVSPAAASDSVIGLYGLTTRVGATGAAGGAGGIRGALGVLNKAAMSYPPICMRGVGGQRIVRTIGKRLRHLLMGAVLSQTRRQIAERIRKM